VAGGINLVSSAYHKFCIKKIQKYIKNPEKWLILSKKLIAPFHVIGKQSHAV
jgi:hypothetical protein